MWGGTGFPFEVYRSLKRVPKTVGVYSFGRHVWWVPWEEFPGGEHVLDRSCKYADTLRRHPPPGKAIDNSFRKEHWHGIIFEPTEYERVLREMLEETGKVTIRTETTFQNVEVKAGRITSMELTDGTTVTAGVYVDGTGGGALCKACGCEMMFVGQESRERFNEPSAPEAPNDRINGVTLLFRITTTNPPAIEPLPIDIPKACWWGRFPAMSAVQYPNGDYSCNMLPTMQGQEFSDLAGEEAYQECKRRVLSFWRHVQTNWPEFQGYRIKSIAPALGVRETTRVVGEYVLTEKDLLVGLSGQEHPDIITIADHSFDRHGAGGGGEVSQPYGVPYRCLIPKGYRNLLIACRGRVLVSLAASSCRLSRTMMQLGQAAGTAAGLAKELGVDLPEVSTGAAAC